MWSFNDSGEETLLTDCLALSVFSLNTARHQLCMRPAIHKLFSTHRVKHKESFMLKWSSVRGLEMLRDSQPPSGLFSLLCFEVVSIVRQASAGGFLCGVFMFYIGLCGFLPMVYGRKWEEDISQRCKIVCCEGNITLA